MGDLSPGAGWQPWPIKGDVRGIVWWTTGNAAPPKPAEPRGDPVTVGQLGGRADQADLRGPRADADWSQATVVVRVPVHGTATGEVSMGAGGVNPDKTEELAKAAFALQELRYLAWQAVKSWDTMSLRKAQRAGSTGRAMEALRAALPTTDDAPGPTVGASSDSTLSEFRNNETGAPSRGQSTA